MRRSRSSSSTAAASRPSNLSEALEAAKAQNKTEMVAMLEQAGAKLPEEFKMDAAQLARFAGTYKNAAGNEMTVTVTGDEALDRSGRRRRRRSAARSSPKDATTFRGIGMGGMSCRVQG